MDRAFTGWLVVALKQSSRRAHQEKLTLRATIVENQEEMQQERNNVIRLNDDLRAKLVSALKQRDEQLNMLEEKDKEIALLKFQRNERDDALVSALQARDMATEKLRVLQQKRELAASAVVVRAVEEGSVEGKGILHSFICTHLYTYMYVSLYIFKHIYSIHTYQ
jgi:hypothetical protein